MKTLKMLSIFLLSNYLDCILLISFLSTFITNPVFSLGRSSQTIRNKNNFVPRQQWNFAIPSSDQMINFESGKNSPYLSSNNSSRKITSNSNQNLNRFQKHKNRQLIPLPSNQQSNWLKMSSSRQEIGNEPSEALAQSLRAPGLPQDMPGIPFFNVTNVVTLVEMAANDTEIDDQTEELLVQTLSQLSTFVGLQDIRDLLGMILMFFILGPIMIPLFWMPITMLIMGILAIPLIYKSPVGRANSAEVDWNRMRRGLMDSQCLEMVSCEFNNILRSSHWSSWIARTFNLTQVEWAAASAKNKNRSDGGVKEETYYSHDDCSKYECILVKPIQRFFGNWYHYIFNYEKHI